MLHSQGTDSTWLNRRFTPSEVKLCALRTLWIWQQLAPSTHCQARYTVYCLSTSVYSDLKALYKSVIIIIINELAQTVDCNIMTSRIDYCNALPSLVLASDTDKLYDGQKPRESHYDQSERCWSNFVTITTTTTSCHSLPIMLFRLQHVSIWTASAAAVHCVK